MYSNGDAHPDYDPALGSWLSDAWNKIKGGGPKVGQVVKVGGQVVTVGQAVKKVIDDAKASGGPPLDPSTALSAAVLQKIADEVRAKAAAEQAMQAGILGYGMRFNPLTVGGLALAAYLFLGRRRSNPPRGRRRRRSRGRR